MSEKVHEAFQRDKLSLPIDAILPNKVIPSKVKKSKKYMQIATSVKELGVVEPLIVFPKGGRKKSYLLLDGHLRLEALKDLGAEFVPCLASRDDEAFTYNKRINRIGSVQEHFMILKAVKNGVSEDRIAAALGVDVSLIRMKRQLLDRICPEAVEILKDQHFPTGTIALMKKMKPLRQVEMAELMIATNNFSVSYARALFMATPKDQLVKSEGKKSVGGISETDRKQMELEFENLRRDFNAVTDEFGANVLRLVVANGYVSRVLANEHVISYLGRHHQDMLNQLESLAEAIAADIGVKPQ